MYIDLHIHLSTLRRREAPPSGWEAVDPFGVDIKSGTHRDVYQLIGMHACSQHMPSC